MWSEKNLWLISKLITVHLPEEMRTMSGLIGPRIHWALTTSFQNHSKDPKNDQDLWKVLNMAGLFWRVHGGPFEALQCLIRGILVAPEEVKDILVIHLADTIYRAGYINEAIHLYYQAANMNPENPEPSTYLGLGNAYQALGNYTAAIEYFDYALILKPSYVEAFTGLMMAKCNLVNENKVPKYAKFDFVENIRASATWYKDYEAWMNVSSSKLMSENAIIDFSSNNFGTETFMNWAAGETLEWPSELIKQPSKEWCLKFIQEDLFTNKNDEHHEKNYISVQYRSDEEHESYWP